MKKYIIFSFSLAILSLSSCEDFVDLKPISEETSSNGYNSAKQIESALTGTYESFQSCEYYVWDNIVYSDVRSDNAYAGGDNPDIFQVDKLQITPVSGRLYKNWSNLYNAISKANLVIDKVDGVQDIALTAQRKQQIKGEALFLRAYHYFSLVKLWGGVPLILKYGTSTDPASLQVVRNSVTDVYRQIIADAELAATLLPDTYASADITKGRATSGSAHALAAKAYAQQPIPDYNKVLAHITALEGSAANYTLVNYNKLFSGNSSDYNNAESIIEVQYLGANEGNYGPQLLLPPSLSGDAWRKFVTPSKNLIAAFDEQNDIVRKNASIKFESVNWVDEYWGNATGSSVPFSFKWKVAGGFASSNRQYLLRYGDIVLLKAEAYNETNNLSAAITQVNRIRNRVSLPDLTAAQSSTKIILSETILKERRLELFQEGQRWDDLVRFNKLVSTMNSLIEIDLRNGSPVNYNMTQAKTLLPIPQQEMDRNPALIQNSL